MLKTASVLNNEHGSVIVAAVLILSLLTILGISASSVSTTEVQISTNAVLYQRAFYTAEAGLERLKQDLFDRMPTGAMSWNWALVCDPTCISEAADGAGDDLVGDYEGGAVWIDASDLLGGVSYTVRVWNNNDLGGDFNTDADGWIYAQSDAVGPRGARSSIRVLLNITPGTAPVTGYKAQQGAGSIKGYISNDADEIVTFTEQL